MQELIASSRYIRRSPLPELAFWVAALIMLFLLDPYGNHVSICPLSLTGISWCPGCGLGKAMAHAFNGEFLLSLQMHPLGFFAIGVILSRIIQLMIQTKSFRI